MMEARDTILSDEELEALTISFSSDIVSLNFQNYNRAIAKAQAEISFKAGIKEVVEWIRGNSHCGSALGDSFCVAGWAWKAKLKEWGKEGA